VNTVGWSVPPVGKVLCRDEQAIGSFFENQIYYRH
jgi:hypothetical protein